jgi:hypothetical protein
MNASDYLENKFVDHVFRTAAFAKPAALYVALLTAAPSDSGGGTEVTGGGYARVSTTPGDAMWTATQGGTVGASTGTTGHTANAAAIQFPAPSAAWGHITHFAIYDAAAAGNLIVHGPLDTARDIANGDPAPLFPPGSLQVTVS